MRTRRKIIEIDEGLCSGCGECAAACAEGAIRIIDGKARLIAETYCDGLGACLGECPEGALTITERESDEFDPAAVEEHLKAGGSKGGDEEPAMACGCPSRNIEVFPPSKRALERTSGKHGEEVPSALTHWPVQIRLIPPSAPFLRNADLLIAADCTPLAYAGFHQNLIPGKVVMLGCPKFDDVEEYIGKFTEIFKTAGIKSVTVVDMEVPCCSKLPMLVRKAVTLSGKAIPLEEIVIGRQGSILQKRAVA
ncbi:MAG: 4Fe-4S binding protein [Syntrophorhabdales bacterium]|jgi:ferredoxin